MPSSYLIKLENEKLVPMRIETKYIVVWANFTLGSNSVKGKARPNILYE